MGRRPFGDWTVRGLLVLGLFGVVGCDQLPWVSKSGEADGANAAVTPAAPAAVAPARPTVLPSDVMASVNGAPIARQDVELRIQELKALMANLGQTWKPLTDEQLAAVVDELVGTELMGQDAVARGRHRVLDVQQRWEYLRRGFLSQEWLRWNRDRLEVTSAEVEAYYEQNKLGFRQPERRRLRHLVVDTEASAKQALARLLDGSVDFAGLAKQISVGPEASQGGLMATWVMRANEKTFVYGSEAEAAAAGVTSLDPALEAAAFAIPQADSLSSYVKGADGRFHIFQLAELQEASQRPLTEVWDSVKDFLLGQKLRAEVERLEQAAKIERFPERLAAVDQK